MEKKILIFLIGASALIFIIFFPFGAKREKSETAFKNLLYEEGGGEIYRERENENIYFQAQEAVFFPIRDWRVPPPLLKEIAGGTFLFSYQKAPEILYQKNIQEPLPFASLAKIMTAMVVLDNYELSKEVEVSKKAIDTPEEAGRLQVGERMRVEGLLELLLLVSSNDAATALAEIMGEERFIDLMNKKAKEIGMERSSFLNPHGLDEKGHFSSTYDLALMTDFSLEKYPKIWEILKMEEKTVIGYDWLGQEILHRAKNTNKLLSLPFVLGGKTGFSHKAGDCMILAMKAPGKVEGEIILVLLGADDRTFRTGQLYEWLFKAYLWE